MLITKSFDDWVELFKCINSLKDKYGYSIISKTIFYLEKIQKNEIAIIDSLALLDVFCKFNIYDVNVIIKFLDAIKDIYRYESIIAWLSEIRDKYNINMISFIDGDKYRVINNNNVVFYRLEINNQIKDIYSEEPFIIQNEDGKNNLYIFDFRINSLDLNVVSNDYSRRKKK